MFTGIVEQRGTVVGGRWPVASGLCGLDAGPLADLDVGDSISVNGVCLTAVTSETPVVEFDVVPRDPETYQPRRAGSLATSVNLERPMPADGRFDGHVVQGHVDGVGDGQPGGPERRRGSGSGSRFPDDLDRYVVEKGSITIDGVSLTVAAVGSGWLRGRTDPAHPRRHHSRLAPGSVIRSISRSDILAKYVENDS